MEMYILDSLLRRSQVVDSFESMIWTERWHDIGDFQLDLKSTLENRSNFLVGTHLAINTSHRVMTVETVEEKTDADGKETLLVKGRSLEAILENRVVKETMSAIGPEWVIIDTPGNVARTMFDHICRPVPALDPEDAIPFLQPGSIFPLGTIPEPTTEIEWSQAPDSLFKAIRDVCGLYDLGFRLVRNFDESELYFDVFYGNDRTTRQDVHPPVVFSVGLDNIQNTTEFMSIQETKNVAYVFSEQGFEIVYGENVDPDVTGFDRRVMVVRPNIDVNHANISGMLIQAGQEALHNQRALSLFDGEVNQRSAYLYGVDYELGDLVEMRNKDGVVTYKRVTEQIFVLDSEGERAYPTLAMELFVSQNTWLSWANSSMVWDDFDTEVWEDL